MARRRVFVAGHFGMVGRALCRLLQALPQVGGALVLQMGQAGVDGALQR